MPSDGTVNYLRAEVLITEGRIGRMQKRVGGALRGANSYEAGGQVEHLTAVPLDGFRFVGF
jgi:hypothetical protein